MKSIPLFFISALLTAGPSALFERGYTVMPEPQKVQLGENDFRFGAEWRLELGPGVKPGDAAVEALQEDLQSRHHLRLDSQGQGKGVLRLTIAARSVAIGAAQDKDKEAIGSQAYRIDLARDRVSVTANAAAGLFYGVETLVQLLKPRQDGCGCPKGGLKIGRICSFARFTGTMRTIWIVRKR